MCSVVLFFGLFFLNGCNTSKISGTSTAVTSQNNKELSGGQVKKLLSGNTFTWSHTVRRSGGKFFFGDDGSLKSTKDGMHREGKWYVDKNELCMKQDSGLFCRTIETDNHKKGFFLVKNGEKRVVFLSKKEHGNTI